MARVELAPGFALNVESAGSGPPLVLLHGFTGSARAWSPLIETLGRHFSTLAVDIVGHGLSDKARDLAHYRMPQVVDDLVTAVQLLGFKRANWLGYSMGGRAALHVAAAFPGAVERLVLIGASPGIAAGADRAARVSADERLAASIERDGVVAFVDYWEHLPLFATQLSLPPETRAAIRAGRLSNDPTGLANSLRGMGAGAQEPLQHRLASIEVPALLLTGELDDKYDFIGREMAARLRQARHVSVPGAGHAAHVENPECCARSIVAFLTDSDQGEAS